MKIPDDWKNVRISTQADANECIPELMKAKAAGLALIIKPMLGPVDLAPWFHGMGRTISLRPVRISWFHGMGRTISLRPVRISPSINLVIVGGGDKPMHPDWVRSIRDQCQAYRVPFVFSGWGEWFPRSEWEHNPELILPDDNDLYGPNYQRLDSAGRNVANLPGLWSDDDEDMHRVGKQAAGRLLDGREWNYSTEDGE